MTSASGAPVTTTAFAAQPPRAKQWVELAVGDCIADVPHVELGEVTVTVVDCATTHQAEVYYRAALPVNAAVADVANQECSAKFPAYTGQALGVGPLAMTYLMDSNQDRTTIAPTSGPAPSNVICLLQNVNGQPLTGSARH